MCGVAGYYSPTGRLTPECLQGMNECQGHRGPDGSGTFSDGPVGLAHRRLAVLDLEHGEEPMTTPDGRYTLVYNGEVYNYRELRTELEQLRHSFSTTTDAEVVLHAFAQWGSEVFDRFNGMWGLAIWDREAQRLTLSRDHFGIKPLYYAQVEDTVVFGSEFRAILGSGLVDAQPDERTIYRYLNFRVHDDGPNTFFAGISRLMPGHMVEIDEAGVRVSAYTQLESDLVDPAQQLNRPYSPEIVTEYRERFTEAVKQRLQSDVPVGTSLSGGLDSSAVAAVVNRLLSGDTSDATRAVGSKQNVFSAVFPGSINDEEKYVDALVETCSGGIQQHKIHPTPDGFKADLIDFIRTQEEPTISTGPYAQYCVMRYAADHVTVLLDGQGADEMLAGYVPYYFAYFKQLKKQGKYAKLAAEVAKSADVLARLGRFKAQSKLKRQPSVPVKSLLNREFVSRYSQERFSPTSDNLKTRLAEDLFHNSLPALLRYEDRNTMRFSLEGRVPFLDVETVRFLFSLSDEAIIASGWNKRILREATSDMLPDMIRKRRNKIGFTTPETEWFYRLKNTIHDVFKSPEFAARPWFNQKAVLEAFVGYLNGKNDLGSMTFWRLLNVELWARIFLDQTGYEKLEHASSEHDEFGANQAPTPKAPLAANDGKSLDLTLADGSTVRRYPLQTGKFTRETALTDEVVGYLTEFFQNLQEHGQADDTAATANRRWHLMISEKIVAITQGRSFFTWEIQPSFAAQKLSKFVTRTPAGIGLGDPVTMQLAIDEVGLPRILYAAVGGFVGKLLGKRGMFYVLAGSSIRAIDGPTEYSVYPSNVSAKLPPKDPDQVATQLRAAILRAVPEEYRATFDGVVVIDANDIGRNVLGKDAPASNERYEAEFSDNPLGQGRQQTPMAVVFER